AGGGAVGAARPGGGVGPPAAGLARERSVPPHVRVSRAGRTPLAAPGGSAESWPAAADAGSRPGASVVDFTPHLFANSPRAGPAPRMLRWTARERPEGREDG